MKSQAREEKQTEKAGEQHDHASHGGSHGAQNRFELIFSLVCGVFLGLGFGLSFVSGVPRWIILALYILTYLFGSVFTVQEAYHALRKGRFEIDFLMLFAAVGAAILGAWAEGGLLLFLFSLGHALEHYAMNRARQAITALSDLAPDDAIRLENGVQKEVQISDLKVGDMILVKPNSKIPADGVVREGNSEVNQAPITGESIPVGKEAVTNGQVFASFDEVPKQSQVYTGTINGAHSMEVEVLRVGRDSTLARLIRLVQEAETQQSPTQQFAKQFEKYFVPAVLLLVLLLMFAFVVLDEAFSKSFYRAMAVLVASSPCALAISTPSAILAGVARAARAGLLVKGGKPLENLGIVRAIAFDKTGTLTRGRPQLTYAIPHAGIPSEKLLRTAIAVESLSDHPLAQAIVTGCREELGDHPVPEATQLEAITARGVKAVFEDEVVHIGNRRLFQELGFWPIPEDLEDKLGKLESGGNTSMIVHSGNRFLGILGVMDIARPEAKLTLQRLKELEIAHMVMLTGDHQNVAEAVAASIGITDPQGSLLPQDKVATIEHLLKRHGKVAMVGDGVNDAPAMVRSTVGIAMGAAGSDVALETADVALLGDHLSRLPFAIQLSRQTRRIIKQNLLISLGMVAVLIPLTITGIAEIGPAVIGHEGSTLVVVLNALRLLGFKGNEG